MRRLFGHEHRELLRRSERLIDREAWRQFKREGIDVARCTAARPMRQMGLQGAVRGKSVTTTIRDRSVTCPADRVNRQFPPAAAEAL